MRDKGWSRLRLALVGAFMLAAGSYALLWPVRVKRGIRAAARWVLAAPLPRPSGHPTHEASRAARTGGRPDILLVVVETLRADHLGVYGYPRPTSPFIDAFAKESVVFENAFSQAPWTLPSTVSLMMGKYPSDLGLPSPCPLPLVLPSDGLSLAERFRLGGYRTVALSDHPAIGARGFGRGFDVFEFLPAPPLEKWGWTGTDESVILDRWHRILAAADDRPSFAYVHLYYPHEPYEPPPPLDVLMGPGAPLMRPWLRDRVVNLYDGEIRRTDDLLAPLVVAFERQAGSPDGSVVLLTSDHGEAFWDHGSLGHEVSLYNELLHVPLVLKARGRIPPGTRVADIARTVDIGVTLLALAGIPVKGDEGLRGRSLLPPRPGATLDMNVDAVAISESPVRGPQTRSIQTRELKVIRSLDRTFAYRLTDDPFEAHPLDLTALPGSERLNDLLSDLRSPKRYTGPLSAEAFERLQAVGYILDSPQFRAPSAPRR